MQAVTASSSSSFTPLPVTGRTFPLRQSDFATGTYRIQQSGVYVFQEDVVFDPDPMDPDTDAPAFILGWFSALSIETNHVVVDLNGFSFSQSERHRLHQRFFSLIELNDRPFRPKQGPANFGDNIVAPSDIIIRNGHMGLSAHHSIHGNDNRRVVISNVCMDNFEVAGVAINGCNDLLIEQCRIGPNLQNVKVNARVSQSHFLLPVLDRIDGAELLRPGVDVASIRTELRRRLAQARDDALHDREVEPFFQSTLPDGSVVGIQFNSKGVAVGPFQTTWKHKIKRIVIRNCHVCDLKAGTREVQGFYRERQEGGYSAHPVMTGTFGSVLEASDTYTPNPLSDGFLAAYKFLGMGNLEPWVLEWMNGTPPQSRLIGGGDSMAHVIKGTMGVFLSGVEDGLVEHTYVETLSDTDTLVRGMMLATCANTSIQHCTVENMHTTYAGIEAIGESYNNRVEETPIRVRFGYALRGDSFSQIGRLKNVHVTRQHS